MKETDVRPRDNFFKRFFALFDSLFEKDEREVEKRPYRQRQYARPRIVNLRYRKPPKTAFEIEQEEEAARQWKVAQREFQRTRAQRPTPREAALMRQAEEEVILRQYQMATNTTLHMQHIAHMEAMQLENFHDNIK